MTSVYVIGTGSGPKKIGIAKNPQKRLVAIRANSGTKVDILHAREIGEDAWKVEGHAHRLLKTHRITGEWFAVTIDAAIAAIVKAIECVANGETIGRSVGRKKQFDTRIVLSLSAEMLASIDASLQEGEVRLDLIRAAIQREIKRRSKSQKES